MYHFATMDKKQELHTECIYSRTEPNNMPTIEHEAQGGHTMNKKQELNTEFIYSRTEPKNMPTIEHEARGGHTMTRKHELHTKCINSRTKPITMPTIENKEERFTRMSLLLYGIAPRAAQAFFDTEIAPSCLYTYIKQNFNKLKDLKSKKIINKAQWDLLFPRGSGK